MNYIKRIEAENQEVRAREVQNAAVLQEILRYLMSSKFYQDPTVQVRDVLTRMEAFQFDAGPEDASIVCG